MSQFTRTTNSDFCWNYYYRCVELLEEFFSNNPDKKAESSWGSGRFYFAYNKETKTYTFWQNLDWLHRDSFITVFEFTEFNEGVCTRIREATESQTAWGWINVQKEPGWSARFLDAIRGAVGKK